MPTPSWVGVIFRKLHAIDAKLAVEATVGVRVVVAVVDDIVVVALLQDAVVSGTVDGAVSIGFENATAIFIRT